MERDYALMDRLPGNTLNELTYRNPQLLDENRITISYQLGMNAAFAYIFGIRDGYQTNYIYNPQNKVLTRIDKETFLDVPNEPFTTMNDGNKYTQEIAACELNNLKYMPAYRDGDERLEILRAFKVGFTDKYNHIKEKQDKLLDLVRKTRKNMIEIKNPIDRGEYDEETNRLVLTVKFLIEQDPDEVLIRLFKAKKELE